MKNNYSHLFTIQLGNGNLIGRLLRTKNQIPTEKEYNDFAGNQKELKGKKDWVIIFRNTCKIIN